MSTKLGTLTLDLVAKISNFTEPMAQAEQRARSSTSSIADSFNVANVAVATLGAAFAGVTVGGMASFMDQAMNTGNEIKKLSQLANTSTYSFQYYAKGAETAGISMESFADKMKDMQDRIGDFQQTGGGPLADFFENIAPSIGVTIQQFQKLSGPEALQLFYNSLEKAGASTNDMKFYMESIISDSSLLIPLLQNGGEGFQKWGDAAERAGAIMSDDMVASLALAKENTQLLGLQWDGMQASLVNNIVPAFQLVSDNLDVIVVAGETLATVLALQLTPSIILGSKSFALSSIESAKYQLALARMSAQAAGTSTTLTVMGGVAKGALSILGGPAGLALTVVGVAASYALFRDKTKDSTVSLRENNESVEDAIKKYTELDKIKRAGQLVEEREKLKELTNAYEDVNTKLIAHALKMNRSTDMTSAQATVFSSLVMEYKTGRITLEQLSDAIGKNSNFTQQQKDNFIKQASAVRGASNEMSEQNSLVQKLTDLNPKLAKSHDGVTNAIDRQKNALLGLTQKQREVYNSIGQELEKNKYINLNISTMGRDKAEYFADQREKAGIAYSEKLSKTMYSQFDAGYKLQQQNEAREESEKRITEQKKKQLEIAEKTVKSQTIDSLIARGEGNYNSVNLGQKYGYKSSTRNLTNMTVEQVLGAQISKEFNAAGKYQVLPGTLKGAIDSGIVSTAEKFNASVQERIVQNYLLTAKKNRKSVEDYIRGKNDDIISANLDLAKEFASVADPTTGKSYHSSKGNNKASISVKEAQNALMASRSLYATAIASGKSAEEAWKAAFNGSFTFVKDSDAQKALEVVLEKQNELEEEKEKSLERQKTVMQAYYSEEEAMAEANKEAKLEIQKAFAGDDEAIKKYTDLQEKAYQKDVAAFQEAQRQKSISAYEAIQNPFADMQSIGFNATAQSTLSPLEYQKWQMGNEQQAGYSQLGDTFANTQKAINDNEYLSEADKYTRLKELHETYLQNKAALSEQYAQQEQDLTNQYQSASLAGYGAMFGMMGSMLDAYGDKSSTSYKATFLLQKAFVLSSALLNAKGAVMAAWNDPANTTIWSKMAAAAATVVQTNELMSAIQGVALTGMAHNGIDSVPKEGTWLLDGGERVLNPQQNKDLTNYLANSGGGSGGDVSIQVNVTDSGVSTQSSNSDKKQLGDVIGNAVRAVIIKEKKQGGLLY